ncbi:DUF7344 domain-containing protein [Haloprofundus salilacus]|uniref:DUF7344 domain-containing protein n=1 Tax=Haloprofundus salilacus TaxID=2876190 RepID=UPI001CCC9E89|nr:hypothetical protein [Haloprofundus salilacus]
MSSDSIDLSGWKRGGRPDSQSREALFTTLANGIRRETVSILLDNRTSIAVRELATQVAERAFETPDASERKQVHVSLVHQHLPTLETAGFVTYDSESKTVEVSAELLSHQYAVATVLSAVDAQSSDTVDEELEALANRRRRVVLSVLDGSPALSLDELAARVVERELEAEATETDAVRTERVRDDVRTMLHHTHLPKLHAFDFVRYDSETQTVERGQNGFADRLGTLALPVAGR